MSVISEVAEYLEDNGVGTRGTDLFYSYLPGQAGTATAILDSGGPKPDESIPTKSPTFQVLVRAADYDTGKSKLDTIRGLLHQKRNVQLVSGGIYFYFIFAISEGGHIGRNDAGQDEFSINFECRTR